MKNNLMRKVFALSISTAVMVGILAGCGNIAVKKDMEDHVYPRMLF